MLEARSPQHKSATSKLPLAVERALHWGELYDKVDTEVHVLLRLVSVVFCDFSFCLNFLCGILGPIQLAQNTVWHPTPFVNITIARLFCEFSVVKRSQILELIV